MAAVTAEARLRELIDSMRLKESNVAEHPPNKVAHRKVSSGHVPPKNLSHRQRMKKPEEKDSKKRDIKERAGNIVTGFELEDMKFDAAPKGPICMPEQQ